MAYSGRTNEYYSSPQEVITSTGVNPKDLGEQTEETLNNSIVLWLKGIKALIDRQAKQDFYKEQTIDEGIHLLALQMASNHVLTIKLRRGSNLVVNYKEVPTLVSVSLLTEDIKAQIDAYPKPFKLFIGVPKRKRVGD
jgi:hypothetical protein